MEIMLLHYIHLYLAESDPQGPEELGVVLISSVYPSHCGSHSAMYGPTTLSEVAGLSCIQVSVLSRCDLFMEFIPGVGSDYCTLNSSDSHSLYDFSYCLGLCLIIQTIFLKRFLLIEVLKLSLVRGRDYFSPWEYCCLAVYTYFAIPLVASLS